MLIQDHFEIEDGILKAYTGPEALVTIPEGVHTIGDGVFKGMSWLLKVELPTSLKKIGASAFKGCRKLKGFDFPEGLSEIGEYAFHRCHDIEEMIFPKSMTKVGSHAFLYCDNLRRVVMEGPTSLGGAVFSHNLSLREISLNKDMDDRNFGDEVFEGCVLLQKITLSGQTWAVDNLIEAMDSHSPYPEIVRSIAKSVFHSLQIEDGVLHNFSINLKSVSVPEGITAIGKGCFFDKKGIINIILPRSLREIKANAFLNCTGLEEVTIQNRDLILDEKAFRGCCNLKRINMSGEVYSLENEVSDKTVSLIRDQVLGDFYISGKILMRYMGDEEQVRIPGEVEIIGERCFFGNERIKTVTCPENLIEIREQAFAGCVALQTVALSDKVKRVEREAFAECKKLLKCNLPDSVEYIGEYAFRRCFTLKPFDPSPRNAFVHPYAFYKAKKLIDTDEESADTDRVDIGGLMGNEGSEDSVNAAEIPGYAFTNKDGIRTLSLSGVKRIGKFAYAACPDLEEIVIDAPECVIERDAFSRCPKLKKVFLHVKEIGEGCFEYCRQLTEVRLSNVSVLPASCFAGCYMLQHFEAKELTQMEARCFDECVHLNSFDFSGIKVIGDRAFERCDSLKSADLRRIECGYHAFADCAVLESVQISPETKLKSGVFIGCTQMKDITYDSHKYGFGRFSDCLNHVDNPYPAPVREVIASVYSCFEIRDRKQLTGYSQDGLKVTVPRDIEEIGQDVFRDHLRLKEMVIPESVKLFGSHAFSQTLWLTEQRQRSEMVIVNNVLLDGTACRGKVEIPLSVKRIAGWCFAGNIHITELRIPSDRIAVEALSFRNCINLKKITDWDNKEYVLNNVSDLKNAGYPELIQRIFSECINCFKLDEKGNLVESTGNITDLVFPEGIRSVADGVYKDCHLLENIVLSGDTAMIGKSAFENSKWLRNVSNAQAVTSIKAQAFSGCQSLESIDLSDDLTELGNRCFEHCISLKEIHISDKLEVIPQRAFFRCKGLHELFIPESVKVIEDEAFAFCDNLEDVSIALETGVSESAFAYCERIRIHRYSSE